MMLGNMMRPPMPPVSFPNPIQRPGAQNIQPPRPPTRSVRPMTAPISAVAPQPPPPPQNGASLSDQKARQRQALLAHTQSFLNPNNKPRVKTKVEVSANDGKAASPCAGDSKAPEIKISEKK